MTRKSISKSAKDLFADEYKNLLESLKLRIRSSQIKAAVRVNEELIRLYWHIGKTIIERQQKEKWGSNVIERLAADLQSSFPGIQGFSRSNIFRMRAFYTAYEKVAQAARQSMEGPPDFSLQIPWWHNVILIEKLDAQEQREWYAEQAVECGWSRSMLQTWIENDLFHRQGKAIHNFKNTLVQPHSDLAEQTLKDPFCFDFLTLTKEAKEEELEQGLVNHIQKFLQELGQGFSFVGRQYSLEVGKKNYYIDLLFFHLKLRSYVVIELKAKEFCPADAGQMNFYLSVVDDQLKHPSDNPSIGMILCKTKDNFTVEYALRDINKPMGVAGYETKIMESLPKNLKGSLPSVEEFEAELLRDTEKS